MFPSFGVGSGARLACCGPDGNIFAFIASSVTGRSLTALKNSGYIVSRPPKDADTGTLFLSAYSRKKEFCPNRKFGTKSPFLPRICSLSSQAYNQASGATVWRNITWVLLIGSVKYTGSSTTAKTVTTSPCRIMCSVTVAASLWGMPLARIQPRLRWVVVTVNTVPSYLPVEKPGNVCGAYAGG